MAEEVPPRRSRRPVAAVVALLIAGVATFGYSAYLVPGAAHDFTRCAADRASPLCTARAVWGFSPAYFLLASLVGLACGGVLAFLSVVLWVEPKRHESVGVLALCATTASVVAYAGLFIGLGAGVAGGILALLFRPPRFREMARWIVPRTPGRPGEPIGPDAAAAPPPALSAEAYAPPPPVWRSPAPPPPAPEARGGLPVFASISEALAKQRAQGDAPALDGHAPPLPAPSTAAPRASAPPAGPPSRASDPDSVAPSLGGSASPSAPGADGPSRDRDAPSEGTAPGAPGRAWKCARCGLTNAPWSKSCTRCQAAAPGV